MVKAKYEPESGGMVLISRFHIITTEREQKEKRFISDSEIAAKTRLNRATVKTYRTPQQQIDRFESKVVTALCHWAECSLSDLLEMTTAPSSEESLAPSDESAAPKKKPK